HKNVLPLLGYCTDLSPALCMISPWMSNGTVDEYVKTHGDADTVKLIEGMARGLDYLHGQNIVHGDLRCSNILVSDEKEAVISGIGMARLTLHMTTLPTIHESHRWRAPEVHLPPKFGLTIEDALALPADVWAFGMTILELLTGEAPYDELKSDDDVSITIISGLIPREPTPPAPSDTAKLKLIDTLWPFCLQCWAHYPASRPT
ncbi:kinase-like protein, partial [Rickenella mellea]